MTDAKMIFKGSPSLRAKRSNPLVGRRPMNGLLRRFAPRNDGGAIGRQAAFASLAFSSPKAKSSQGVSASRSLFSMVAPHQMRRPGGASRYEPTSKATFSFSRNEARPLAKAACASAGSDATAGSITFRQTLVFERVSGADARKSTQGVLATQSATTLALASARAISALRPPKAFAHLSASI